MPTTLSRLLLVSMLFAGAQTLSAQGSITMIDAPTVAQGSPDDLIQVNFDVRNDGAEPVAVRVRREEISIVEGTINYFCWEQCYAPNTSVSPTSIIINPGQQVSNFYADYQPYGIEGTSVIRYCFYDENNPSDESCLDVEFVADQALSTANTAMLELGSPSPNAATDLARISYRLKQANDGAALKLFNILGAEVKSIPVSGQSGTIDLTVADMPSGVYIYSFINGNKILSSSKLVVN